MKKFTKNICKFSPLQDSDTELHIINFVFESNKEILCNKISDSTYKIHFTLAKEKIQYCGAVYEVEKNSLFFTFPAKEYRYISDTPKEYYISFIGRRALKLMSNCFIAETEFNCFHLPNFRQIFECAISVSNASVSYSGEGVVLLAFSAILNAQVQNNRDEHHFVFEIKKYIDQNFRDEALSLKMLSQKYHYNTGYISTVFKKKIGISFCDYLNMLRLNYAQSLILSGYTNVTDIAYLSGYCNREYFSRLYQKKYKIAPKRQIALVKSE